MANSVLLGQGAKTVVSATTPTSYLYGALNSFTCVLIKKYDPSIALDITGHVLSVTLYEDLFAECIVGDIDIVDSIDLLNGINMNLGSTSSSQSQKASFPIIGEEVIQVTLEVVGQPKYIGIFEIYAVNSIDIDSNFKTRTYSLKICSREKIIDSYILVQKGYNQPIADTANSIFSTYIKKEVDSVYTPFIKQSGFTSKNIVVEETNGNQKIVIPRLSPFESMNFLRKRAISSNSKNASGTYLFFEDRNQYNFCDIETMISNGLQNLSGNSAPTYTYLFGNQINIKDVTLPQGGAKSDPSTISNYKTITEFTQHSKFDTIEKLRMGVYESDVLLYDFIQNNVANTHYTLQGAPPVTTLGKYVENSNTFITNVNGKYTRKFFMPIDSSVPNTYIDQIVPRRNSYFTRLSEGFFTVETLGDLNILVGQVISLNLPNIADEGMTNDKYLSGNFLIGSIKHKITPSSYHTTLDLYKIGYEASVDLTSLPAAIGVTGNT